ncbi:MAG: NAD+ synthase [Candidatus Omnitrophota bacterium]|jgi:NAD+ synthase (glutamine-hydrolysing)
MEKTALAQINCLVGGMADNAARIVEFGRLAADAGNKIVIFPELAVTGYPPEDLLLKPSFVSENLQQFKRVVASAGDIITIFGFVDTDGERLYNAAAVAVRGQLAGIYRKIFLPNYGVFDERRYFAPGKEASVFKVDGISLGVSICEDIWHKSGPVYEQAKSGAGMLVNISASPYHIGKIGERRRTLCGCAADCGVPVAYVNLVGGQDELVFDGRSMFISAAGEVVSCAGAFKEELFSFNPEAVFSAVLPLTEEEEVYSALTLGLKDYAHKNGFKKAVLGLSGGIDSALTAALAADALGSENVTGVFLPTRYTSEQSHDDAFELSRGLGIGFRKISIEPLFRLYLLSLEEQFSGLPRDRTEENLQARIRGALLMALSNKFGWLVLATGNKSEMSVGYSTIYGDLAGGFAILKDVPKTLVYRLAEYRNRIGAAIPESIIAREPTAELSPGQKDSDSLPLYSVLDPILKLYVEEDVSAQEIIAAGFFGKDVRRVISLVDSSEYKRRQSPPGIKITPRAFGKDRRMPITNAYDGEKP